MPMGKVIVYSMKSCPYCVSAKQLLKNRNVPFEEILVGYDDDAMWEAMEKRSGMKTVPQIFLDDRLIGGLPELQSLDAADKLESLKK